MENDRGMIGNDLENAEATVVAKVSGGSVVKKIVGFAALAAVVAGVLYNLDDIRRYVRISRM